MYVQPLIVRVPFTVGSSPAATEEITDDELEVSTVYHLL